MTGVRHWDPIVKLPETWGRPYVSLAGRYKRTGFWEVETKWFIAWLVKEVGEYGVGDRKGFEPSSPTLLP